MKTTITKMSISLPARYAMEKLGQDLNCARRARRISTRLFAKRLAVSRGTLCKMEKGDPSVSMGSYGMAIFLLGLLDNLKGLLDIKNDPIRRNVEEESLPKHVRARKFPE